MAAAAATFLCLLLGHGGVTAAAAAAKGISLEEACPAGVPLAQCISDPCLGKTCVDPPDAICAPYFCGGCKVLWYIGDDMATCLEVKVEEIITSPPPPADREREEERLDLWWT